MNVFVIDTREIPDIQDFNVISIYLELIHWIHASYYIFTMYGDKHSLIYLTNHSRIKKLSP